MRRLVDAVVRFPNGIGHAAELPADAPARTEVQTLDAGA